MNDYDPYEHIIPKIMDKDEMDVILESLRRTGHDRLANSIKDYIESNLCGPYEDYPPEMPIICFAPI